MKPFLPFFAPILLSSCQLDNRNSNDKITSYIIYKQDSINKEKWKIKKFPPPLPLFYGDYNFIFDSVNNIYLHTKKDILRFCGTDIDNNKPDFINLKPDDLKLIDKNFIDKFLLDSSKFDNNISLTVVSDNDTINSKQALKLITFLKQSKKVKRYNIRFITEEENVVLDYKKKSKQYFPEQVKWTNNFSIGFPSF